MTAVSMLVSGAPAWLAVRPATVTGTLMGGTHLLGGLL